MAYTEEQVQRLIEAVEKLNRELGDQEGLSEDVRDAQEEVARSTEAMGDAQERTSRRTRTLSNDMTALTRAALNSDNSSAINPYLRSIIFLLGNEALVFTS